MTKRLNSREIRSLFHHIMSGHSDEPEQPVARTMTLKVVSSWSNNNLYLGNGERRQVLTSRLDLSGRHSPVMARQPNRLFGHVPLTHVEMYVITDENRETPMVEMEAAAERRALRITFQMWDQNFAQLVNEAAGSFAVRVMINVRAEYYRGLMILLNGSRQRCELAGIGAHALLPNETPIALI